MRGYPPAVLFAVGLLFVILVLLHYSTVISRLSDQNVVLAQRLALLETKLERAGTRLTGVLDGGQRLERVAARGSSSRRAATR